MLLYRADSLFDQLLRYLAFQRDISLKSLTLALAPAAACAAGEGWTTASEALSHFDSFAHVFLSPNDQIIMAMLHANLALQCFGTFLLKHVFSFRFVEWICWRCLVLKNFPDYLIVDCSSFGPSC